jgi:O-antigen ligase
VIGAALILVFAGSVLALRHNDFVENTVFHTDEHSSSNVSSNAAHLSASRGALAQVVHEPFGRGPGTAGPAGEYNSGQPPRIAENYFLQIGQETGWLGLVLFAAIYLLLAGELWRRRQHGLPRVLLASLAGLTVLAMLMHLWTDDTIAYLWFGLAGIALTIPVTNRGVKSREKSASQ